MIPTAILCPPTTGPPTTGQPAARHRRNAVLILAAAVMSIMLRTAGAAERPNIVLILADDLAWSDLGCQGNRIHETPRLDQLAAEGCRFRQAYAAAPICSASRAAILTGRTPAELQFEFVTKSAPGQQTLDVPLQSPPYTLDLPLSETTLAEALNAAGYRCGFFGKWHLNRHHQGYLGWSPTHGPLQQGFDEGQGDFGSHPYAYRSDRGLRERTVGDGTFPTDSLVTAAESFVRQHAQRPFFLYLSHYYVHDPVHSRCEWLVDRYRQRLPTDGPPARAPYAAMVETLDHLTGRLLDVLDECGLRERTVVIFTSDNGGHPNRAANAPLRGSKWNLYEGGIRVPLLLRWPKVIAAGSQSDAVVHSCDLFPTLCDVADIAERPAGLSGVSLVPHLRDPGAAPRRTAPLVWHFPYYHPERGFDSAPDAIGINDFRTSRTRPQSALRSGPWKLLHFHEDDRLELYDLSSDIGEQQNLATAEPQRTQGLKRQLDESLRRSHARFPQRRTPGSARAN